MQERKTLKTVPCKTCLVYPICYSRFKNSMYDSVTNFAWQENCKNAIKYTEDATQNEINSMRVLFDLQKVT